MESTDLIALALACAPLIHPQTSRALIQVESAANANAIGVVGGQLTRQPRTRAEAIATARMLIEGGWNFSIGLAQINVHNLARLGLTIEQAFEPCPNLRSMQTILLECHGRASTPNSSRPQHQLHRALSCYYSNNFTTGFLHGYVARVQRAAISPRMAQGP